MRDYQTKGNVGGGADSIVSTKFGAGEFNSLATENENAVSRAGLTLAAANGAGEDTTQLAQSLFIHSVKASSFQDNGVADAYDLTPTSGASGVLLPSDYAALDGARVSFVPGNANTGAITINIGQTTGTLLGSKAGLLANGSAFSGGELGTVNRVSFTYSASADGGSGAWILDVAAAPATTFSVFSSSGTWTAPTGCNRIRVYVVGGGGAGAGAAATSVGTSSFGAGGTGGAMAVSEYTPAQFGASQTVTIGAGGAGASGLSGGAGGTSSFGALATAEGGGGGNVMTAGSSAPVSGSTGSAAVVTTGANIYSVGGGAGSPSFRLQAVTGIPGNGGPSPLGGGIAVAATADSDGTDGIAPGGAGSGASALNGGGARTGGDGAAGIVIVEEYY